MQDTTAAATRGPLKKPRFAPTARAPKAGGAAERAWAQGVALARAKRDAQALPHLRRATELAPREALYWINRAAAERRLRLTDEAMGSARRAFELNRADPLACKLLAELLRMNNRDAEALKVLRSLDGAVPRDVQHLTVEGGALMALREWQQAALVFLQVLQQRPADIEAYMQLGHALASLRRFGEAAECFRTITLLEPAALGAAVYAPHYSAWSCDWAQGAEDETRLVQAIELQSLHGPAPAFSPFCMLAMNDDAALHLRLAAMEAARVAFAARDRAGWVASDTGPAGYPEAMAAIRAGRIRVGFVSADFRTHATSLLIVQTLERLPRDRFEVVLYSHGPDDGTPLRERVVAAADRFVDCTTMNNAEQAARIRADGIVLLVDLCGYTASSRLGLFSLKPAPVQASWLAYPGSTGADFIDYMIGDPVVLPLSHAADFSEKLVQLPACYQPTDAMREHPLPSTRAACGLPEKAFVFASFNQSYKITEPVFDRWCRILRRVPGSVLWLLVPQPEIQDTLKAQAARRGLSADRLVFAPFVSQSDHLSRLPLADLFLDTFPCGAHTTCNDALWMGLPVLTRAGRTFASRVAASLLHAALLPGLVTEDVQAYERRAVELATTDLDSLKACREHLVRRRLELPLFDNESFTAGLATAFEGMADRWVRGQPASHVVA